MCSIVGQAAHLLQAPKSTAEQLADVAASCFKLNSLQLRCLLERYRPAPDEPSISPQLVAHIVRVAEGTADELLMSEGRPLRLEEDAQVWFSSLVLFISNFFFDIKKKTITILPFE